MKTITPEVFAKKRTHFSETGDRPLCGATDPQAMSNNIYKVNCIECIQKQKKEAKK